MFQIKVAGIVGAKALMQNGWPTRTVSVVSPKALQSTGPHHLVVEFNDIEVPQPMLTPPELHHIEGILEFTSDLTPQDRVLIHCHAGMRRSTAVAIGVMVQHGMGIPEAFAHCFAIRPIMMPNRWLLRLLDDALSQNGTLGDYGDQWVSDRLAAARDNRVISASDPETSAEADVSEMERLLRLLR